MAMTLWATMLAGFAPAMLSGAHCAAMCGPLAAFASRGSGRFRYVQYQLGRVASYSALGVLVGAAGGSAMGVFRSTGIGETASVLFALGLVVGGVGLWRSAKGPSAGPAERTVQLTPRAPKPNIAVKLMRKVAGQPLLLGLASALLPCGALASGLLIAASMGNARDGAIVMATFAGGTGIGLVVSAKIIDLLRQRGTAGLRVAAVLLWLGAATTVARPLLASQGKSCCHPSETSSHAD